jgi:hypothetical protein
MSPGGLMIDGSIYFHIAYAIGRSTSSADGLARRDKLGCTVIANSPLFVERTYPWKGKSGEVSFKRQIKAWKRPPKLNSAGRLA